LSTEQAAIADATRNDTALYSSIEFPMGSRLTGSGGLRFDHVTTENRDGFFGDRATSNNAFSGFGSLKADLATGLSLTGQVSRGFRDPTLSDRYYYGISGRGFVTGNPNLEPETALQFDMALRYLRGGMIWAAYAYHYTIEDLIERFELGRDLFFLRNRGRARLRGLELEVSGEIGEGLRWQVGAQVANGIAIDDNSALDDIPVENVTVQLEKSLGPGHYVRVRGALFGRNEEPGPTERPTPRYGIVDVGGGWRINRPFQLRFLVRNLFDQHYPVSADRRAVLAPGINAVVTLTAEF
jgi:iron complex outermembrane receptor protein